MLVDYWTRSIYGFKRQGWYKREKETQAELEREASTEEKERKQMTDKAQEVVDALIEEGRWYGDGNTIHQTGQLDVEVRDNKVVAVWFRCSPLPFKQIDVDQWRAAEMETMYESNKPRTRIRGVTLVDN